MDKDYDVITIISKYPFLRRPGVVAFADIIKIVKTQEKLKELEIIYQNPIYMCIS